MRGLLVVGDVVTDIVARHAHPLTIGTDTPAEIVLRPGGSGANTAAWAAHLGADTRLLCRVGRDTGAWHTAELVRAGVTPHVRVDPDRPTAVVIAMVDGTGERTMLTNRGAGGHLGVADWTSALLDGVAHLHLSGYTLFAEPGLELARLAMREATERGVTISVDPASAGFLRDFGPERFLREIAPATIVIPNLAEALLLTGEQPSAGTAADENDTAGEEAGKALSTRYGTAVVKLGSKGALLARKGRVVARTSSPATEIVDSTGAGDAFAGGFLAGLLSGLTPEDALRKGCAAGSSAVAQIGGRPVADHPPRTLSY